MRRHAFQSTHTYVSPFGVAKGEFFECFPRVDRAMERVSYYPFIYILNRNKEVQGGMNRI